jgi:hypothetical protein
MEISTSLKKLYTFCFWLAQIAYRIELYHTINTYNDLALLLLLIKITWVIL